jgi:hypothetical protein
VDDTSTKYGITDRAFLQMSTAQARSSRNLQQYSLITLHYIRVDRDAMILNDRRIEAQFSDLVIIKNFIT